MARKATGIHSTTKPDGRVYRYFRAPMKFRALGIPLIPLPEDGYEEEAARLLADLEAGRYAESEKGIREHLIHVLRKAKNRATDRGIEFAITMEDIDRLLAVCPRCAVSGIPFTLAGKTTGYRSPCRPSIDRIDAQKGYTPGNIRLVCVAVNAALSDWGDDVFWTVVRYAQMRPSANKRAFQNTRRLQTGLSGLSSDIKNEA
jgi:hypothetical protein